ncbi:MAG: hypothetical protein Q9192_003463 [Flavoplaca navasiana]
MIAPDIPEQWYDRLNQIGPQSSLLPFSDDEPPFHLQKPSSDEGSTQAFLEGPISCGLGGNSQPQPLSYSLLSRLELSENDPNTFRDIIDDLTVQNKVLKRHLKRYEQTQSISKAQNALFEVRIHNLPPEKKHELEVILQNFTATVQVPQNGSGTMLAASRKESGHQIPRNNSESSSPSPPSVQPLDSAYASMSATGVTIPAMPSPYTRQGKGLHKYSHNAASHGASSTRQLLDSGIIQDREKQELIVQKLEQLYQTDAGISGTSKGDKSPNKVPSVTLNGASFDGPPPRPNQEIESTRLGMDGHLGSALPQRTHKEDSVLTQTPFLKRGTSRRKGEEEPHQTRSTDQVRHPGHLRVASPTAESDPQSDQEWVYLNLLVNMAQLHTLNVTPESVRKALHDYSTKLVLSDDGSKVKWRGETQDTTPSPKRAFKSERTPLASSKASSSAVKLSRDGRGSSIKRNDGVQEHTINHQSTALLVRHSGPTQNQVPASKSQYKPMFAPRRRRSTPSHSVRDDQSVDSDKLSSSTGLCQARRTLDKHNGPMIFLERDPFFLDLSANHPDRDRLNHASYGRLVEEPIGGHNGLRAMADEFEGRLSHDRSTASGATLPESIPFRSLKIYDGDPIPSSGDATGPKFAELQASGMGGIQLDDNFAIEVKTGQHPPSAQSRPPVGERRAVQTRSKLSHQFTPIHRPEPAFHDHRFISSKTTHLPPSPLPPPSYVYPAVSSSSSASDSENDDEILDDVESISELEFRPLSLSPQMRMFLETEEEALAPENDEGMDVESDDQDRDEDEEL